MKKSWFSEIPENARKSLVNLLILVQAPIRGGMPLLASEEGEEPKR